MRQRAKIALLVMVAALVWTGFPSAAAGAKPGGPNKVTVCLVAPNGTVRRLSVNPAAARALIALGNPVPGDEATPGYVYDDSCEPVRVCVGEGSFAGTFREEGFRYPMTLTMGCSEVGEVIAEVRYPVFGNCDGEWTLTAIVDATTIQVEESIDTLPCETGWTYQLTYDPVADQWRGFYLLDPENTFRVRRA